MTTSVRGPGGERPAELTLRWQLSRHARRLLTTGLAGLLIAVITRRPEFAGAAAPALLLLAARRPPRPARVAVRTRPVTATTFENEPAAVDIDVTGHGEHTVELTFHPAEAVEAVKPAGTAGDRGRFGFTVRRWGKRPAGTVDIVLRDRARLSEGRASITLPAVSCYPRPAHQRATVTLSRLPRWLGEHPARTAGDGAEFAGVREYVPGDRQRRINWPASTRRGRLQVNTFAAERAQDVVLMVDTTSDVGEPGESALDLALRGATAAARAYLGTRDRVGFIAYRWGGVQWLAPGLGRRQVYRITDAMLAGQAAWSPGETFRRLPRAALPPGALVVAFSPLLDQRFVEALRDLRERGFAILVVDVLNVEPDARRSGIDKLTRRIWRLEQQAIRFSLREIGVPVVHWDGEQSLDLPLAPYTRRPLVTRR